MKCPKCGEINKEDAKFCIACGTNLKNIRERPTSSGEQKSPEFPPPPSSPVQGMKQDRVVETPVEHGKSKILPTVIVVIAVILFILFILRMTGMIFVGLFLLFIVICIVYLIGKAISKKS